MSARERERLAKSIFIYGPTCVWACVGVRRVAGEGPMALWGGFAPYYIRCGGNTVVMFVSIEQVPRLDGWMDGWMDGWVDGWMDGYVVW